MTDSAKGADDEQEPAFDEADDQAGVSESTSEPTEPPRLRLAADQAISDRGQDRLGYQSFAEAIAAILLDVRTETPLTLAISGPWGAGKTSLVNLVRRELKRRHPEEVGQPLVIDHNAWSHQAANHPARALSATVMRELTPHRGFLRRFLSPLPLAVLGRRATVMRRTLRAAGGMALTALVVLALAAIGALEALDPTALNVAWAAIPGVPVLVITGLWVMGQLSALTQTLASFFRDPSQEADRGTMATVSSQLQHLLGHVIEGPWQRRPVVLVIDDLDRVDPHTAIEICETVTQLFDRQGVVVILLADIDALEAAAEAHYPEAAAAYHRRPPGRGGRYTPPRYGTAFLQKLVHFQVRLPPATTTQLRAIIDLHASSAEAPAAPSPAGSRRHLDRAAGLVRQALAPQLAVGVGFTLTTALMIGAALYTDGWRWAYWVGAVASSLYAVAGLAAGFGRMLPTRTRSTLFGADVTDTASVAVPAWVFGWAATLTAIGFQARSWRWAWGVAALGALGVMVALVSSNLKDRRWRAEKRRRRASILAIAELAVRQAIRDLPPGGALESEAVEDIADQVDERATKLDPDWPTLNISLYEEVQRLAAEWMAIDSPARRQAEAQIAAHFLPVPRGAKRLVNQIRFLLYVAQRNGLLVDGADSAPDRVAVTAEQLGRWAIMGERWPEVLDAIEQHPALLGELETASHAEGGQFARLLTRRHLDEIDNPKALARFLAAATDPLGPVAAQLVHLQPDPERST